MPKTTPETAAELRALASRPRYEVTPQMVVDARLATGLSQLDEIAGLMACGERTWQQWEGGKRGMSQRDYEFLRVLTLCPEARAILRKLRR